MQRDNEDDAWRAIVENYGDRPEVEAEPAPPPAAPEPSYDEDVREVFVVDEGFVPPDPPPPPRPPTNRLVAWLGVFGSPAVLLLCVVLGIALPSWLAYVLVAWFVGGFFYLVALMPRGPRDPWDDGAEV